MIYGMRPGEVQMDPEGCQTMRNLGRNLAWMMQCIEQGPAHPTLDEPRAWTHFVR